MLDNRPPNAPTEEPPAAGQTHARLSWKWLRRGAWFALCAAGLLWLAHAPFIRGWVLAELASRLGARYGVSIVATG
ncbi:MAG: hypothetical protein ACM3NQ_05460, partial [Bacteroidales bacterium]